MLAPYFCNWRCVESRKLCWFVRLLAGRRLRSNLGRMLFETKATREFYLLPATKGITQKGIDEDCASVMIG